MGQLVAKRFRKPRTSSTYQGCTVQEIADMLNLTRERVRKIEARAILKLRKYMQLNKISPQDYLD